jgi:hypothetical protein
MHSAQMVSKKTVRSTEKTKILLGLQMTWNKAAVMISSVAKQRIG